MPLVADSMATYGVKLLGRQRQVAPMTTQTQTVVGSALSTINFGMVFPAQSPGGPGQIFLRQNEVIRLRLVGAQLSLTGGLTTVSLESAGLLVVTVGSPFLVMKPAVFGSITALAAGASFSTDFLEFRRYDLDQLTGSGAGIVNGVINPSLTMTVNKTDAGNVQASVIGQMEIQRFQFDTYDLPDWNPQ